jgi:hypothetical protein
LKTPEALAEREATRRKSRWIVLIFLLPAAFVIACRCAQDFLGLFS